jgi:hypothetical protein
LFGEVSTDSRMVSATQRVTRVTRLAMHTLYCAAWRHHGEVTVTIRVDLALARNRFSLNRLVV